MLAEAPPQVLIVDDTPSNRVLLEHTLRKHGFRTQQADNGKEALDVVATGNIDLVMLDAIMPELDGFGACVALRAMDPLLPIIMVTSLADDASRIRGKQAGADEFLTRPIVEAELLARMKRLLEHKRARDVVGDRLRGAERAAHRWRLASRVAELVSMADDPTDFERRLLAAIGDDLPIRSVSCGFVADASCPIEVRELVERAIAAKVEPAPHEHTDGAHFVPFSDERCVDGGVVLHLEHAASLAAEVVDNDLLDALVPHVRNAASRLRFLRSNAELTIARERLTALVVHDLKNPLTVVQTSLHMLRESVAPGDDSEILADALTSTDQMLRMLLDLLDVSRAEAGALPCKRVVADLAATVRTTAESMRSTIEQKPVTLQLRGPARVDALFDPQLIQRVLQNLLANASRYALSSVDVEITDGSDLIEIAVSNNGPPIPPDVLQHLFDKYGQHTEGQSYANRGLGLYLCRLVVERHQGSIRAVNLPETGVCFTLRLPRPIAPA
jgi:signal transduction histidine kinase